MSAQWTVGEVLPNGATVVSDDYTVNPDGSTFEAMVDSEGNGTNVLTPSPETQAQVETMAQAQTDLQNVVSMLAPGLVQAQVDLQTLAASTDALAPILTRVVQDVAVIAQAVGDLLIVTQTVSGITPGG